MNEDKIDVPASVDLGLGVSLHLREGAQGEHPRYSVRITSADPERREFHPPFDVLLVGEVVGVVFNQEQGEASNGGVWESLPVTGLGDHNRLAATLRLLARAYARGRGYNDFALGARRIRLDDFDRQLFGHPLAAR